MVALTLLLFLAQGFLPFAAQAATESVDLKYFDILEAIKLPTVTAQYQFAFTRPKTWQVSPATHLELEFQHSLVLIPGKSWLKVLVNDKEIKHIPYTEENAKGTKVSVPIPPGLLKDFNTLTFRVEQHYTDHCEDPLDPSLWTTVLNTSKLVFDYTDVLPRVDLQNFPYPVVDPLTYSPTGVKFILPQKPTADNVLAMGLVNTYLAGATGGKELRSRVVFADDAKADTGKNHLLYVGTAGNNPDLYQYENVLQQSGYTLSSGTWYQRGENGAAKRVSDDAGIVAYFAHPQFKNKAVVIVSGNTDKAVLRAARYLSDRPKPETMGGSVMQVPADWNVSQSSPRHVARFIENETRTLNQLGYGIMAVEKITAAPIIYHVPVMTDFHPRRTGAKLFLDLVYSYGPGINPEFSSLEIRWNNRSIANIPLLNQEKGEELARATIPVSGELVAPNNVLVAQFHLMPDKYGYCVDNYEDKAWGKIHDDSQVRVTDGKPASRLPNVGLLNSTGFPYTRSNNLKGTHFILPESPTLPVLTAFLGMTNRLGRAVHSDTDLRFTVGLGGSNAPGGGNIIAFNDLHQRNTLPGGNLVNWVLQGQWWRQFKFPDLDGKDQELISLENGQSVQVEQYANGAEDRVVTAFTSNDANGFLSLANVLEDDSRFEKLPLGRWQNLLDSDGTVSRIDTDTLMVSVEAQNKTWWQSLLEWFQRLPWMTILWVVVGLLALLIIFPLLISRLRRP
ncbi:MAG: cellulose biosynthesis cyclic di-GMP-binding regulatory protein BcsB [Candidatus Melainabacteria bacterium]